MIESIIILVILAFGMTVTDIWTTRNLHQSELNGYGTIPGVREKVLPLPVRHRVLIALILGWIKHPARFYYYSWLKFVGNAFGIVSFYLWTHGIGFTPTQSMLASMAMLVLIGTSLLFDYADYGFEIGFVCLTYWLIGTSYPWLALLLVIPWAMMRESAIYSPIIMVAMQSIVAVPALLLYLLTRGVIRRVCGTSFHYVTSCFGSIIPWKAIAGKDRPCGRGPVEATGNWDELVKTWRCRAFQTPNWYGFMLWGILSYFVIRGLLAGHYHWELLIPGLLMFGAAVLLGKWCEIRVYLSAACPLIVYGVMVYA